MYYAEFKQIIAHTVLSHTLAQGPVAEKTHFEK